MLKAKPGGTLRALPALHQFCSALLTRRPRTLGPTATLLVAALLTAELAALLLWGSAPAQAQDGDPPPVENLRCIAETDLVGFLWDKPEWSGGEAVSYDYELSLPDGRNESGRLQGGTVLPRPGSYLSGKEASISVKANYETDDGRTVSSAAEVLVCYVEGEPEQETPTPTPTPTPAPAQQEPEPAPAQEEPPALSSDATLRGLELIRDGSAIPLRPAFDPQTNEYGAAVPLGYRWASLRPTTSHAEASITVDGKAVESGSNSESFFLEINTPKRVEVVVTAEDGVARRGYAVTATYTPLAQLEDLSVSQVELHPLFSGLQTDYRGWAPYSVEKVRVTPTNAHDKGTIRVNGEKVASRTASDEIALAEGENVIAVTITSPDDYTSRSYTVRVVRASAAASADATLRGLAVHTATGNQPDSAHQVPYAGPAYQLTPALTAGVYDYRVRVPDAAVQAAQAAEGYVYVTTVATTTAPGARSIVVSGKRSAEEARPPKGEVLSGESSGPWWAFEGYSLITVVVTSLDGSRVQTYRVLVERGTVDDPQGVSVTPGDGRLTLSWDEHTGSNPPGLYWARWREAGTTSWLNAATLSGWKTGYGDGAADGTAADGQRMSRTGRSYDITGLTNGTEYEVELRGTRGGDTSYRVTNWLKSRWVATRGTPGQPAQPTQTLVITPSSPTREYGGTDDLSYAVSGLAAGDAAGDVVTGALSRAPGNDVGSYAISMGTLAIAPAHAAKYTLPSGPAITTYAITPRTITAISGVAVTNRPADGSTHATFDTSSAQGTGVLPAELADFRLGGLVVSGSFPAATPGTHRLSVTYSLRDQGSFKAANYTLSATADTLPGELTEVAACGSGLMLGADSAPAEGGPAVTVTAVLSSPAGPGGVAVTLTTGGTATMGDDYTLSAATVRIAAGATAGVSTVTIIDDAVDDDDETIILNAAVASSSLTASPLTLTITDNDDAPEPRIGTTDYDTDDDGLIEVSNLAQLYAVGWELDGDGVVDVVFAPYGADYAAAFPDAAANMGCPSSGCEGYELVADLDFDTNGNGEADSGDAYWSGHWHGGLGWSPIGNGLNHYRATFEGNGHVIRNLYINAPGLNSAGLFGSLGAGGIIRNVALESVDIVALDRVGGLVAYNQGTITGSYVTGEVSARSHAGGLVGESGPSGVITGSYSTANVSGTWARVGVGIGASGLNIGGLVGVNRGGIHASYATGQVSGKADNTGGLVGYNEGGSIVASYASGDVSSTGQYAGGLVGNNGGDITASYAVGETSATGGNAGGLVGRHVTGVVTNSYWDTEASGLSSSPAGVGKTTAELKSPTGYTGIYANWNVDLDGDTNADNPWDFGKSCQYPVLKYGGLNPEAQREVCQDAPASSAEFKQVSAGGHHTCGVKTNGELACWGYDRSGQASPPSGTFKQVSAGVWNSCGVKTNGELACWGWDLGESPPSGTDFKQVSAWAYHACAVKTGGELVCWGWNGGRTEIDGKYVDTDLPSLSGTDFNRVSVGDWQGCVSRTNGKVVCWGKGNWGDRWDTVTSLTGTYAQVSVGAAIVCVLRTDGEVACNSKLDSDPRTKPLSGPFTEISAGGIVCGLKSGGQIACWGANVHNLLTPPSGTFTQVSAGGGHACGVKTNGELVCWGLNRDGQASPPPQQQQGTPNQVPTVSSAIADATIVNERGTKQVSLSGVFSDADADALTVTATSSHEAVATENVAPDHSSLTVNAQARGTTTITVTADDGNGGTVSDTFTVRVKAAPTVASSISDISGLEVDATQEVSLSGVFRDADGDPLTIEAASSDDAKATVTVAAGQSKLTVAGVAEGSATITVTAQDADGNRVSDTFEAPVARKYASLITKMKQWRNDPRYVTDKAHTDRWDRTLLAFGETVADTTLTPMTAAEARGYADRGWTRWVEVAAALREIEAS